MGYFLYRVKNIEYGTRERMSDEMKQALDDVLGGIGEADGIICIEDPDLEKLSKHESLSDQHKEFWKMQHEISQLEAEGGLYYEVF